MFLGIFETFAGLMTLFSVTTGTSNYHYAKVETRTISPNTLVSSYNLHEKRSSGTSVTFEISDDTDIYTYSANQYCQATWYFWNNLPNATTSSGAINFYLEKDENNDYTLVFSRATQAEIVNLHLNCYIEFITASTYTDSFTLDLTKYRAEAWHYYSTPGTIFDTDYFDDGGIINITFQLEPVSQEEWYGYYDSGYNDGYDDGVGEGYQQGFTDATEAFSEQDTTAVTIFTGICNIGLMPINFFLGILNFEVFGINIGGFVSALLTVAIVIIIVRIIFNGGNGDKGK